MYHERKVKDRNRKGSVGKGREMYICREAKGKDL
jgi:hypothetical protein